MNTHRRSIDAFNRTAASMASTLASVGRQRPEQTVIVKLTDSYQGVPISHIVFVVPHGEETGDYWHVSHKNLWRLNAGIPPEEVGCELASLPDQSPEYPDDDRACSQADRLYQERQEQ
ncbi:MAG: hypothetical protein E5Y10_24620 [Mesorhizobium sp.]|nr:MAG: hypothetical protein E5Y10_24620 [Mesorhizobium sp.]